MVKNEDDVTTLSMPQLSDCWDALRAFPGGSDSKGPACNAGDLGSIPGSGRSLQKGMATHSSTLAWRSRKELDTTEWPTLYLSDDLPNLGLWDRSAGNNWLLLVIYHKSLFLAARLCWCLAGTLLSHPEAPERHSLLSISWWPGHRQDLGSQTERS